MPKGLGKKIVNEGTAKVPNIKLREGAEPITVSGLASCGDNPTPMRFPTLARQEAGWCSKEAKLIALCYGDRYELLNGGCNCDA